ncbi:hypothetical protein HHI36_010942 [Cryptolaemus montrouzieri]|uniref:C2H2-type domain-containing protein n=1 Tax=Cryptolaemus montrouzieri TaxID=559131 RepID=A0ABD2MK62_9CUCU
MMENAAIEDNSSIQKYLRRLEENDSSESDSDSTVYSEFAEEPLLKRYKCTYEDCNKSFYRPSKLAGHIKFHIGERIFKCEEVNCKKAYFKKDALKRHKKRVHLQHRENAMCPIDGCLKVMSKASLKKHTLRKHNTLRKFQVHCPECNKGFKNDSELKTHMYQHTVIYKCPICEKVFEQGHRFRFHVKSHKNYKCSCEEEFLITICSDHTRKIVFNQNILPNHHKYVHNIGEQTETFKCTYSDCTKEYRQLKNLKQHAAVCHEGKDENVAWMCEICKEFFKKKEYLKRHQKNLHFNTEPKISKPRKPRCEKGIPKVPMVTQLTGIELTKEDNKTIIMEGRPPEAVEETNENLEL